MKKTDHKGRPGASLSRRLPQGVPAVLFGLVTGGVVCLAVLMLTAAVMTARDLPENLLSPLAVIAGGCGALAGGYVAARRMGRRGLAVGAACGGALFLLLWLIGLAAGGDTGAGVLLRLAVWVALAAVGGVWGVSRAARRKDK